VGSSLSSVCENCEDGDVKGPNVSAAGESAGGVMKGVDEKTFWRRIASSRACSEEYVIC
jgi:hypothetical protein